MVICGNALIILLVLENNLNSAHCVTDIFLNFNNAPLFLCELLYVVDYQIMGKVVDIVCAYTVKTYFVQILISHWIFNVFLFRLQYNISVALFQTFSDRP